MFVFEPLQPHFLHLKISEKGNNFIILSLKFRGRDFLNVPKFLQDGHREKPLELKLMSI